MAYDIGTAKEHLEVQRLGHHTGLPRIVEFASKKTVKQSMQPSVLCQPKACSLCVPDSMFPTETESWFIILDSKILLSQ
jgi:hypothetical protein